MFLGFHCFLFLKDNMKPVVIVPTISHWMISVGKSIWCMIFSLIAASVEFVYDPWSALSNSKVWLIRKPYSNSHLDPVASSLESGGKIIIHGGNSPMTTNAIIPSHIAISCFLFMSSSPKAYKRPDLGHSSYGISGRLATIGGIRLEFSL